MTVTISERPFQSPPFSRALGRLHAPPQTALGPVSVAPSSLRSSQPQGKSIETRVSRPKTHLQHTQLMHLQPRTPRNQPLQHAKLLIHLTPTPSLNQRVRRLAGDLARASTRRSRGRPLAFRCRGCDGVCIVNGAFLTLGAAGLGCEGGEG